MPISWLDVILIIIMLVSGFLAMVRGFTREVLSIFSWAVAAVAALYLTPKYWQSVASYFPSPAFARVRLRRRGVYHYPNRRQPDHLPHFRPRARIAASGRSIAPWALSLGWREDFSSLPSSSSCSARLPGTSQPGSPRHAPTRSSSRHRWPSNCCCRRTRSNISRAASTRRLLKASLRRQVPSLARRLMLRRRRRRQTSVRRGRVS